MINWFWYSTHDQEVVGSNPAVYWMDGYDKKVYITYIEKKKNKGSQMGHTKKIRKKSSESVSKIDFWQYYCLSYGKYESLLRLG